ILGEISEIILFVKDMHAQVLFYRDKLGLEVKHPGKKADYSKEFWVELATGAVTLALHAGGKGRIGEDAPKIVLRVKNGAAARTELIARGVKMGEVRSPVPGLTICDCADPEGNRVSIEGN